jgi:hypothetical protein
VHNLVSYKQFVAARANLERSRMLAQFETIAEADFDTLAELICEDERGLYVLPFPGRKTQLGWINPRSCELIRSPIIGWRKLSEGIGEPRAS